MNVILNAFYTMKVVPLENFRVSGAQSVKVREGLNASSL